MKLLQPKRHEVDPAITTSTDENASWEARSQPLPLSNLTFIEPEFNAPRCEISYKIYSRDAYVS